MQNATASTAEPEDAMTAPGFEHRLVRAADAPPMPSPGVRSVFDLARGIDQAAPAPAAGPSNSDPAKAAPKRRSSTRIATALQLLKTRTLTSAELAEALGVTTLVATKLASNLVARKGVIALQKDDTCSRIRYTLPELPKAALKAPSLAPRAAPKAPAVPVVQAAPALPITKPTLRCALFNTGHLHVEVDGQPALLLDRGQARDLVAYLDQISSALAGEV